jgi:hypothetical protein
LGSVTVSPLPAGDILVAPMRFKTGTGTSATGTISIYLLTSEDNTVWTGGIDPASSSSQATPFAALQASDPSFAPVHTINANADSTTYYTRWWCISEFLNNVPSYMSVLVVNNSGAALSATAGDHYTSYKSDVYA